MRLEEATWHRITPPRPSNVPEGISEPPLIAIRTAGAAAAVGEDQALDRSIALKRAAGSRHRAKT